MDYKQRWAIDQKNKKRWLELNPTLPNASGIYILTREEKGLRYAYVGQAKKILQRLCDHLRNFQHIDLSLKKHGLWSKDNLTGWKVDYIRCPESELDAMEQELIKEYGQTYQLRNHTLGGQIDKIGMEGKTPKGYYDGLKQGRENLRKEIAKLFSKYLYFAIKQDNVYARRAYNKFEELLKGGNEIE